MTERLTHMNTILRVCVCVCVCVIPMVQLLFINIKNILVQPPPPLHASLVPAAFPSSAIVGEK